MRFDDSISSLNQHCDIILLSVLVCIYLPKGTEAGRLFICELAHRLYLYIEEPAALLVIHVLQAIEWNLQAQVLLSEFTPNHTLHEGELWGSRSRARSLTLPAHKPSPSLQTTSHKMDARVFHEPPASHVQQRISVFTGTHDLEPSAPSAPGSSSGLPRRGRVHL